MDKFASKYGNDTFIRNSAFGADDREVIKYSDLFKGDKKQHHKEKHSHSEHHSEEHEEDENYRGDFNWDHRHNYVG